MNKFFRVTIILLILIKAVNAQAQEANEFDDSVKKPPLFVLYPAVKYTIPTVDITRKSDGKQASFIAGDVAFELMFQTGGIPVFDGSSSLTLFMNSTYFKSSEQRIKVNEMAAVSHDIDTSISGYYAYFAPTLITKTENQNWNNVIDTFGLGLGFGTGNFKGTAKFETNGQFTNTTPVSSVQVDTFKSWVGFAFLEHNFSNKWLFRLSFTYMEYNNDAYNGSIDEVAIGLSRAFSF